KDARGETMRAVSTFRRAAEEARRFGGELLPLDVTPAAEGRVGITRRYPIGVIAGISPFNFPLNLACHKVAPAIAVGCPIVLKPASKVPLSALLLAEVVEGTAWPKGAFSVVPANRTVGDLLVTDPRFAMLSFTGSPAVGWDMKERCGPKKKVVLELGGNAGMLVDRGADIDLAARRGVVGAFSYAGQVCISVQRIFVHDSEADAFEAKFLERVRALRIGDPMDEANDLGPMIDEKAARRTQEWVDEAVAAGARVLAGGRVDAKNPKLFPPTVLTNVRKGLRIECEEAFAPVVILERVKSFEEGLARLNDSHFGLQAGVFTNDLGHAWQAFDALDVGGVIINDVPTFRVDNMPYGGVKDSGFGREGLRYAMEDMTELRVMVVNRQAEGSR
ncbi:MAG: aldehyde dehydrogenase family protein, partial [Dactylosporangium sp.]|nr:aldehyde dehydrogenase family protein [Dactylosporangium sp.]